MLKLALFRKMTQIFNWSGYIKVKLAGILKVILK